MPCFFRVCGVQKFCGVQGLVRFLVCKVTSGFVVRKISLAFFDVQDLFRVLWYARYDLIWMFLTKQRTLAQAGIRLSQREVFKHLEYSSRCVLDASHTQ